MSSSKGVALSTQPVNRLGYVNQVTPCLVGVNMKCVHLCHGMKRSMCY